MAAAKRSLGEVYICLVGRRLALFLAVRLFPDAALLWLFSEASFYLELIWRLNSLGFR